MGTLRIYFTSDDLCRTRLAAGPDPMWEIVLSRFRLHDRRVPLTFQPWVHRLRSEPARVAAIRPGSQVLAALAPLGPYFPDFLTPVAGCHGLDAGLDAVMSTPRRRLRQELCELARYAPVAGWAGALADGDPVALGRLCTTLRVYYDAAIAPLRDVVQAGVDADRARRAHGFLDNGVEGLLASMRPIMRWQPPVLEVDYDLDKELHLHGRGLRLVPSFFCHRAPVTFADPELMPVLIYPIDQELHWPSGPSSGPQPLPALIGGTRAAVLRAIDRGATTTQLARRLDISAGSASRHATVLRDAGLIASYRHGAAVLHTLTPLGTRLLEHDAR